MLALAKLHPDFGLEATGVDLAAPLTDVAFKEIEDTFFAGQVLVLHGQRVTA